MHDVMKPLQAVWETTQTNHSSRNLHESPRELTRRLQMDALLFNVDINMNFAKR